MILLLVGAILTFGSVPTNSGISRNPMSMMDIWMNRTEDGNVLVAHGVNSWPALLEQLTESTFAKSAMIEGDVLLYKQRKHRHRAIPLMSAPSRLADRITFKEWLYEVTKLNKVVKINVRTTEAVRPVLQYLFAAHKEITSPIVLHANVFRSPRSIEPTVDADALVEETKRFFPEATLSLGWTKSNVTNLTKAQHRISWRELFHIIGLLFDVQQSVMISVRLTAALCSVEELSFLLGMRPTISVLIWSDETDIIHDWSPLVTLRSTPYSKRLIFDLNSDHVKMLKILPYQSANVKSGGFIRKHWHRIEFPLASSMPSGIVESDEGVAFLGWPKSFLISLIQPPLFPSQQTLSAKIKFIKKRGAPDELLKERSGLAVYFLEKVVDIQSPNIDDGIMVFIGYSGQVFIENRDRSNIHYQTKSVGQLSTHHCRFFEIIDRGWQMIVTVENRRCDNDVILDYVEVTLETPLTRSQQLRNAIVSKVGDGTLDILLQNVRHSCSSTHSVLLAVVILIVALTLNR